MIVVGHWGYHYHWVMIVMILSYSKTYLFIFSFISPGRNIFITSEAWCRWYLCKGSYGSLTVVCVSLVPMMVPKTTSETLKHKINPSIELPAPQAVDVLLYTPGTHKCHSLFRNQSSRCQISRSFTDQFLFLFDKWGQHCCVTTSVSIVWT